MTSGLQPIFSGAPTPVSGVTGGPGLPQGVASVDGTTGNVVISPGGNTTQLKKSASPQSLQIYEFDSGPSNFARLALSTTIGGPMVIAAQATPTVPRELQFQATSLFRFISAGSEVMDVDGSGVRNRVMFNAADLQLWYGGSVVFSMFSSGATRDTTLFGGTGVPSVGLGQNGDYYLRGDGVASGHIYFKSAGAWTGIV